MRRCYSHERNSWYTEYPPERDGQNETGYEFVEEKDSRQTKIDDDDVAEKRFRRLR